MRCGWKMEMWLKNKNSQIQCLGINLDRCLTCCLLLNMFSLGHTLTMNRFKNDKTCRLFYFIFKNHTRLRKCIVHFSHVMLSLGNLLRRLLAIFWLNVVPNLHYWSLHYQHAYIEYGWRKISQLYPLVLLTAVNYRIGAVRYSLHYMDVFLWKMFS